VSNNVFIIVSILVFIVALSYSDLSGFDLTHSFMFPIIAFISLAASVILFANRNSGK